MLTSAVPAFHPVPVSVLQASHLLKYDSTLGKFDAEVKVIDDQHISVNGKSIRVVSSRDPTKLPWGEMDIDLVIEGTGVFIDTPGASKHIEVGGTFNIRSVCGMKLAFWDAFLKGLLQC
jgi:glyceraldehyde-3-phosphate dehydrogenase/erythrose-4-phosphate dehydrogenase